MAEKDKLSIPSGAELPAGGNGDAAVHPPVKNEFLIQDASSWVLRIGVVLAVVVMVLGLAISFLHQPPTVAHMQTSAFNYHFAAVWRGVLHGRGEYVIDVGVFILVLTPIMRVATSVVLFAFVDRDWFYALVTLAVLFLTLVSLLFLH